MPVFRISKYDPQFRIHGKYTADEWSDYSDIGSSFNGKILTEEDYLLTEKCYIQCIIEILYQSHISSLRIINLEKYEECVWTEGQNVTLGNIDAIICDCLRNVCWCKLERDDVYVHFGYDYYVYMSSHTDSDTMIGICDKYNLFAEKILASPYDVIH